MLVWTGVMASLRMLVFVIRLLSPDIRDCPSSDFSPGSGSYLPAQISSNLLSELSLLSHYYRHLDSDSKFISAVGISFIIFKK